MRCDWPKVSLESVTSILGDGLHGTPKYDDSGEYFFINGNNLSNGNIVITDKTKRCDESEYQKYKKNLNDRTVLVSINGTIGNVAIYNGENVFLGKSACYFNVKEGVDKEFIKYIVISPRFQNYIKNLATGSTIKNVSLKLMRDYKFYLPSITEQQNISKILGEFDKKIKLNRQLNQTLEEMAQAIFKSWFVDFVPVKAKMQALENGGTEEDANLTAMVTISGKTTQQLQILKIQSPKYYQQLHQTAQLFPAAMQDSELGEVPQGWRVSEIGNEVTVVGGGTPSTKNSEFWDGGEIFWATPKDLSPLKDKILLNTGRKITSAGLAKISSGILSKNTVLMSSRAPVGYLALAKVSVAVNQGFIAMKCENELTPEFVLQWCNSVMNQIQNRASGTTFMEISKKNFKPIPVIVPSEVLIKAFTKSVGGLYNAIESNLIQSQSLSSARDKLLPKLLSGEVKP